MSDAPYLLPYVRVLRVLNTILTTRWDDAAWSVIRREVPRVLELSVAARQGRVVELSPGGRRLRAALAAVLVHDVAPELRLVHRWLDGWRGVGAIAAGMQRQGFDLQMTEYPQGWRVNFRRRGADDVVGSGWHSLAWVAMQQAAWAAVIRVEPDRPA